MAFADNFTFSRPNVAPYATQLGVIEQAAVNVPRIGYSDGTAVGLIVEAGNHLGQNDSALLIPGLLGTAGVGAGVQATVLHCWRRENATMLFDAHYTTGSEVTVNGCLARVGWHASVQVVPGYLHNWGGWVWAFGNRWQLAPVIAAGGNLLADGNGRPVIGR